MTVVKSFPSITLSALPLTDTMKIKQTLDSTAEATVISENNQNAKDGSDIEYGDFHRRSLTAIAELDESNMIGGNPVVISKDDTTVDDADNDLSIVEINKVVEQIIGYVWLMKLNHHIFYAQNYQMILMLYMKTISQCAYPDIQDTLFQVSEHEAQT